MHLFKHYRNKGITGKTYLKSVGQGFETGFTLNGTPVFIGNFIHASEARKWFAVLNKEIKVFSKKYKVGPQYPVAWYKHFISTMLYSHYYRFLDKVFVKHNRVYLKALKKDVKKYQRIKKNWSPKQTTPFLKVA